MYGLGFEWWDARDPGVEMADEGANVYVYRYKSVQKMSQM